MVWRRENITPEEFQARLLYSLMLPVARLASRTQVPLKEVVRWLRIAYFQELRARGATLREIAALMDVSQPTAARLAREARDNFLLPEREHQLPQRLEFMLWASPMSAARLHQCLPEEAPEDIDAALALMSEQGRIAPHPERPDQLTLTRPEGRLMGDSWVARIGSLNSLLDNLDQTVKQRFLDHSDDAFARTLNLRVALDELPALRALYEDTLWPALVALDARARHAPKRVAIKLSLLWARGPREDDGTP